MILQADARHVPMADESVDLILFSPPFFALRSYRDGGRHYDGQIGSEATPQVWLEAMWEVMREMWRLLKPSGSCIVECGDKRAGSGGHNNAGLSTAGSTLDGTRQQARTGDRAERLGRLGRSGDDTRDVVRARAQRQQQDVVLEEIGDPSMRASRATRRNPPDRYNQAALGRAKSKMLLPHRFAIGCEDGLADPEGIGWIVRQDGVWSKTNGLPESVDDRCRDAHSFIFHLTKQGAYYSAIDEIREPHSGTTHARRKDGLMSPMESKATAAGVRHGYLPETTFNPLGRLPGSVWTLPTEPLSTPDYFVVMPEGGDVALWNTRPAAAKATGGMFDDEADPDVPWRQPMRWLAGELVRRAAAGLEQPTVLEIDHFAAFPTELARRCILGWSPPGICVACGEGRSPVVAKPGKTGHDNWSESRDASRRRNGFDGGAQEWNAREPDAIVGYACACTPRTNHPERRRPTSTPRREDLTHRPVPGIGSNTLPLPGPPVVEFDLASWTPPPTRPAVVLDPFSGTGTTAMVARSLGRIGIGVDLSADYCRLARWRVFESGQGAKVVRRTNVERQGALAV
ncbi:MAG TPA: DNA methyltransferase [Acidimicrobiales bacterium]